MSDEPILMETAHDPNAETAVLAACLDSRPARDTARKHITGSDFHDPRHEIIWNAMRDLDRAGDGVDASALLSALTASAPHVVPLLPALVTWPVVPEHVATYAENVREWSVRRKLWNATSRLRQQLAKPGEPISGITSAVVSEFSAIRDSGSVEDAESVTLGELLEQPDTEPDWVIPGYLERRDRLMLTGEEGLGKSYLLRQMAVMGAAGLDPFDPGARIRPLSVLIVDCENTSRQVQRKVRPVVEFARRYGKGNPDMVNLLCSRRVDITSDRDLARLHREADACQPDLIVIGPLYRLVPRALQTDDEAAPVLAALDTLRDRGIALLIEAHAGHAIGKGGVRDLRPRGSSALLGWPEFGYGMRNIGGGYADFVAWRGARDERDWPVRLRQASDGIRWVPDERDLPVPEESRWTY